MKAQYRLIALLAFACLLPWSVRGQAQKTGYVNTEFIIQQMPEYDSIKQQLQRLSDKWKAKLAQMKQDIKQLKQEYNAKKILYTEQVRKQRWQNIEDKTEQRKQFLKQKFGPEGDYFQKQKQLLQPIQEKIYQAIIAVSQRMNMDFVFDRAKNSSLLFARKEWNLNKEVLSELGITLKQ